MTLFVCFWDVATLLILDASSLVNCRVLMTKAVVACVRFITLSRCPANPNHSIAAKPWHVKRRLSSHLLLTGVGFDTRWELLLLISPLLHDVFFFNMADSTTQIKCLMLRFNRQSLASSTKTSHFTKVSILAGNMSVRGWRFTFCFKRDLGKVIYLFFILFIFHFPLGAHVLVEKAVAVCSHIAPYVIKEVERSFFHSNSNSLIFKS